jgi:hypothetical protein
VWYLSESRGWTHGVASADQLAYRLSRASDRETTRAQIEAELHNPYNPSRGDPDEVVEMVLDFNRQWISHRFPRTLMALHHIQREVFVRNGLRPGNYAPYAAQVENRFQWPYLATLDEYGIPLEIAERLRRSLSPARDLDDLLDQIMRLDARALELAPFEAEVVRHAQAGLA